MEQLIEDVGLTVNQDFISEIGGLKIPKVTISSIEYKFGHISRFPLIQLLLSLIVSVIGTLPILHLYIVSVYGGKFKLFEALGVSFLIIGIYLLFSSLRKGAFLEIRTNFGTKRIVFRKGVEQHKINQFLNSTRCFDYPIL